MSHLGRHDWLSSQPGLTGNTELLTLCEMLCDDLIGERELERLDTILQSSQQARRFYKAYMFLHGELLQRAAATEEADPAACQQVATPWCGPSISANGASRERLPVPTSMSATTGWPSVWIAACLVIGCVSVLALGFVVINFKGGTVPVSPNGLALLVRSVDCQWIADCVAPQRGQRIEAEEKYVLTEGTVEILLDGDVRIIVEGPAEFNIPRRDRVILSRGKLVARVPHEATGFSVFTPSVTVVDLGTEFGVAVDESGSTEVHVFDGVVQLKDMEGKDPAQQVKLNQGESRRIDADSELRTAPLLNATSFIRTIPPPASHSSITISTEQGAGADTFIRSNDGHNYGGEYCLGAMSTYKVAAKRKIWLRFDVSEITSPTKSATLRLTMVDDKEGKAVDHTKFWDFEVWGMKDVRHGVPWDADPATGGWIEGVGTESTASETVRGLSWWNAGGNCDEGDCLQAAYFDLVGMFRVYGPSINGEAIELSTSSMREFIADDSNGLVTFVILRCTPQPNDRESTVHWFASKEHPTLPPPQLILELVPD